ncbi:MAG TPA: hypothetical protein VIK71_08850 [Flavobacteriales bacterium]
MSREIFSANLMIGYQGIKGRFVYDAYFGLGYRYRSVTHHNRIDPLDMEPYVLHPRIFGMMDEGKFSTPNITLGFRMGYVFPTFKKKIMQETFD